MQRTAFLALVLVAACRPVPQGPRAVEPEPRPAVLPPEAEPKERPLHKADAAPGRAAPLGREDAELRRRGVAAMDEGRFDEAARLFERILEHAPANMATQALHTAALEELEKAQKHAGSTLTGFAATVVARPPFRYTLRKRVPIQGHTPPPKLRKLSEARNKITDDGDWFQQIGLRLPEIAIARPGRGQQATMPPYIPMRYGNDRLVRGIQHPDHTILLFGPDFSGGRYLAVLDRERTLVNVLDFASFTEPPGFIAGDRMFVDERTIWGQVIDGVLYVSHFHRTYAKSSKGQNGYITALDVRTGELLWRSAPLVANSSNFLVRGGYIITGYGFTAEPDYMYVLDRTTGKTVSRQRVKTGPDYILERGDRIYVRTYDTNYVFEIK